MRVYLVVPRHPSEKLFPQAQIAVFHLLRAKYGAHSSLPYEWEIRHRVMNPWLQVTTPKSELLAQDKIIAIDFSGEMTGTRYINTTFWGRGNRRGRAEVPTELYVNI